jgi:hypothetical protein
MGIFWIATLAIVLQVIINLEAVRYTLYTGEPIVSGFQRLRPASMFWSAVYSLLTVAQLGMPALGAACAAVVFSAFAGRLPSAPDKSTLDWLTYAVMVGTTLILMIGGTIERMLERASWLMIGFILLFLTVANILFVPFDHWHARRRASCDSATGLPMLTWFCLRRSRLRQDRAAWEILSYRIGCAIKAMAWAPP